MSAPLVIRDRKIEPPFLLAPMAGYTHRPFRLLCRRLGAGLVYTELTSVDGLVREAPAAWHMLATDPGERPVAAHLYGRDPETFARAAAMVEARGGFDLIDINAGCPVPKVVARGAGAGLLKEPKRLFAIVRAVRAAVSLPVTVKTRIGWSARAPDLLDLARGLEEAGAEALALHARPTKQRHSGEADWEAIAAVRQVLRIPVIGNGGVRTPEEAMTRLRESGVDAVMIGRGALGNPWIFEGAAARWHGQEPRRPSLAERRAVALEHLDGLVRLAHEETTWRRRSRFEPETAGARRFRGHLVHYFSGFPGATQMRRHLNEVRSPADIAALIAALAE
jgi:nifR3 family TIM-barrel protein